MIATPPRTARVLLAVLGLAATLSLGLGGCVNQGEYDNLYVTNRSLTDRNKQLERERDAAVEEANRIKGQIAALEKALADLRNQNAALQNQLNDALKRLADLGGKIGDLGVVALDPDTDAELRRLAAQYPDLLTYDPEKGMIRFASDLTFDSGDDTVKPEAKRALSALSQIVRNQAASKYELVIVGHTDSQRISSRTAARHPTNVHLSAHRSISVRRELVDLGVEPGRMQVAGWGEFRPAVPNSGNGNTPQNRRVEIYLTRGSAGGGVSSDGKPVGNSAPVVEPAAATPDRTRPPERPMDITK
ncbi:MAG: OmpA family protein [Planctomycetota bacterium]|jgi:chemotaxis protein MotB|nr:OmpA family protein [Planctomycetota bacterium]